jgi:selenocysteine lyase/cysteine desulfurase
VTVRDLGAVQCGIVTFTVDGVDSDDIVATLAREKINTVSSSIFSTRYDMELRRQTKFVRASAHYLTTEDEIELLAEEIERLARG